MLTRFDRCFVLGLQLAVELPQRYPQPSTSMQEVDMATLTQNSLTKAGIDLKMRWHLGVMHFNVNAFTMYKYFFVVERGCIMAGLQTGLMEETRLFTADSHSAPLWQMLIYRYLTMCKFIQANIRWMSSNAGHLSHIVNKPVVEYHV